MEPDPVDVAVHYIGVAVCVVVALLPLAVIVALVLICAGVLHAAPAPFRPVPPVPALCIAHGEYQMTWQGTGCRTIFSREGEVFCSWFGNWWHGVWACKDGVLTVTEWPMAEPHRRSTWRVTLKDAASGYHAGGTPWRITPIAGKVY